MQARFIEQNLVYDGSQLRSLFAYINYGVLGDSIVGWIGPCDVSFAHMIDGEDLRAQSPIRGKKMAHFIVELFGPTLANAVAVQRLTASLAIDVLKMLSPRTSLSSELWRDGDDIYAPPAEGMTTPRKLSVSIATVSPVSALIHFAVNVSNEGTPVETLALEDLEVEGAVFAQALMEAVRSEIISIQDATRKVRPATSY